MNRPRATTWFLGAAVVAVLASGCSSSGDSGASVAPPSGLDTTSSSAAPAAKPTVIQKQIGETSGYGCGANQAGCSDLVQFTITDVSAARGCSSAPKPGKRFIHVAGSASTSPDVSEDEKLNASLLLNASNWQVVGSDGYTTESLDVGYFCSTSGGPFQNSVDPGTKQRGDVVFEVPVNSVTLELHPPRVGGGGWSWKIPAA